MKTILKNILFVGLIISLILNIYLIIENRKLDSTNKTVIVKANEGKDSFLIKIQNSIKNSVNLINKNIKKFDIDSSSLLINEHSLFFYFNDKTCGTCIDEALVDLGSLNKKNLDKITLLVSFKDKRDYLFLNEKIDYKYPIVKVYEKDIPFLSPTFLIINKDGDIVNAHTYVKEFPDINKLFLKSINNMLMK